MKSEISGVLKILSYSLICTNFVVLFSSWGIALNNLKIENFYELIFQPLIFFLFICCYGFYVNFNFKLEATAILYCVSWFITLGIILFKEFTPLIKTLKLNKVYAKYESKEWVSFSWPVLSYDVLNKTSLHIGIIIAGVLLSASALGQLSLYIRLANMPSVIVLSFSRIFSKTISYLYYSKKYQRLSEINENLRKLLAYAGMIIVFIMIINGPLILSIFGSEYLAGITGFNIITIGLFFSFYFGTSDYLLLFSSGENKIMYLSLIKLIIVIALMFWLIPEWKLLGACIAVAVAHILHKILVALYIGKIIHMKYLINLSMIIISIVYILVYYTVLFEIISQSILYSIIYSIILLLTYYIFFREQIISTYQEIKKYK